jgi:nucleolar protein 56
MVMRAYLATGILGSFAFDSSGKTIAYRLFPKKPEVIAEKLMKSRSGEAIPEELDIIKEIAGKGFREVVWSKELDAKGMSCIFSRSHIGEETMQGSYRKLALDLRWVSSQAELNDILSKVNILLTRSELREGRQDQLIIRVSSVLDELDRELNVFSEKLREWYGLHFPEAGARIQSHERYAEAIAKYRSRDGITEPRLKDLAAKSSGMKLSERDLDELQAFSKTLLTLFESRKRLALYLEGLSGESMPNTSAVAGPSLAARLLSLAGGLEKMARMPSSTIQLLGAEKALFRHLRGEGKAPKYGILFSHPLVQAAPKELKGKTARLVASKISLAARTDFFSGADRGKEMKEELETQAKRIRK